MPFLLSKTLSHKAKLYAPCTFCVHAICCIYSTIVRSCLTQIEKINCFNSYSCDFELRFTLACRLADWNLLDTLTWPAYLVRYLMVMGYANGPEWKGFYTDVLEKDYYTLSAAWKLMVLQILCDDVLDSEELRAEIDMREESEVGINSDAVATVGSESGPRRVHPRYSKTSACRDEESVEIMAEPRGTRSSSKPCFLGVKGSDTNVDADAVNDGNSDECRLCGMDGTLLCCDGCPSAYHSRCIGVTKMFIPEGAWYCPECIIDMTGPTLGRGTSLRGAEVFGVDSYGQVFLGTCNHLLVYVSGSLVPILLCFLSFVDMLISTVLAGLLCYSPYNWFVSTLHLIPVFFVF